jgi:hypothetical protein
MTTDMTFLEDRYRRLLRWLPEPARSRWTEDMVDTYLTAAIADDAEVGTPSLADQWDVWRLALRLRLGAPGGTVRAIVAGQTVRLVALAGSVALATMGVVAEVGRAWMHGLLPALPSPPLAGTPVPFGLRGLGEVTLDLLAVALVVCLIRGAGAARPLAGGIFAGWLVLTVAQPIGWPTLLPAVLPLITWIGLPLLAAALAPSAPVTPSPRWVLLLPVVAVPVWAASVQPAEPIGWLTALASPGGLLAAGVVVAGMVLLARRPALPAARLAIAIFGLTVLPGLAAQLSPAFEGYHELPGYRAIIITGLILTALTVLATGIAGARAVHALPAGVPSDHLE